jgi:hypothetical protein
MKIYKISQTSQTLKLFRGDPKPIELNNYNPEYGVKELNKQLGSSLAEGPGIYFTTDQQEAKQYGENITTKSLKKANIITKQNKLFNYQQINKILQKIDKEKLEMAALNWDENFHTGKSMLIKSILNTDNPIDQLMNIWSDVFYHQNPKEFMEVMTNNGIDGIAIQKNDAIHYIIYNTNILE